MTELSTPRVAPALVARRPGLARRALDRDGALRRLDWTLLVAAAGLCTLGVLLVWSATRADNIAHGLDPQAHLERDLLNVAIAVTLGALVTAVDYRALRTWAPVLYALSLLGLLLVLSPAGARINGAHAWIRLGGGFEVQPSEFAKIAVIVLVAALLAGDDRATPRGRAVARVLLVGAVPMALVLVEPDLGMAMVLGCVLFAMIALSGAPARWVLGLLALGVLGAVLVTHLHLLKGYQLQRLTCVAHPHATCGYNVAQSRIAIGSGGLFGTGLFHGPQTNGHFVPEQQTDFVFSVAGEELGFVGAAILVLLEGVVIWRALRVARAAADRFGALIATGVVAWLAFQTFENVGMTLGLTPVTGLPLPLVSYGGSSLFATAVGLGLVQSVRLRSRP